MQPAIEKLDPHLIHQATNQLKVAERYAVLMLASRNIPADLMISEQAAQDLVQRLVNEYPTHGFVISRDEAIGLGLPVDEACHHPRWQEIREVYNDFTQGKTSVVKVITDESLDANTESETNGQGESYETVEREDDGKASGDEAPASPRAFTRPTTL